MKDLKALRCLKEVALKKDNRILEKHVRKLLDKILIMDRRSAEERLKSMGYSGFYEWYDPPGTFYDWHTHPEDEVRYVLEGEITIGTEEGVFHLKAGDFLEVKAGTRHWAKTEKGVRYLCGSKRA